MKDKQDTLKWHFDNNLGDTPFKTFSAEYNKDESKYQELFLDLGLNWPAEESDLPAFFDNLDLEQTKALLELFKNK